MPRVFDGLGDHCILFIRVHCCHLTLPITVMVAIVVAAVELMRPTGSRLVIITVAAAIPIVVVTEGG